MSTQVTTAFVQQYSANVQMLSQQMGSRLRDAVRVENMTGKNAFFDQVKMPSLTRLVKRLRRSVQLATPTHHRLIPHTHVVGFHS
jgi:hypothetical protein